MNKRMWSKLAGLATVVSVPALVLACGDGDYGGSSVGYAGPAPGMSAGTFGDDAGGSPSQYPMTVMLDTNQTMNAQPGQGVGVFVTYDTGGNWNVWWTCDTDVDTENPACAFQVQITAQTGEITNVSVQNPKTTSLSTTDASLTASTTTSTATDGVTFSTAPGAKILLSATVAGQYDGRFIFFVQDDKIDDGYSGSVTDPIYMQGKTP